MVDNSREYKILDKKLQCLICNNTNFMIESAQINGTIANFLGIGKNNTSITGYICDKCGHIMPFIK